MVLHIFLLLLVLVPFAGEQYTVFFFGIISNVRINYGYAVSNTIITFAMAFILNKTNNQKL